MKQAIVLFLFFFIGVVGSTEVWSQNKNRFNIQEPDDSTVYEIFKESVSVLTEIEYYKGKIEAIYFGKVDRSGESVIFHLTKGVEYGIISFIESKKVFDLDTYACYIDKGKVIIQSKDTVTEKYSRLLLLPARTQTYSIVVKPIIFGKRYREAYYCIIIFCRKE